MLNRKRVGVFVYGDLGRSPRMQNHAEELSKQYEVFFMGYIDSSPRTQILSNQHINLVDLEISGLGKIRAKSFYLYALIRIILQILQIIYLLGWKYRNLQFILIQNPPSIPNLFAIWLTSFISFYKIYIDFHNYGYTILQLKIKNSLIIKAAKLYEKIFGRRCSRAFCVSDAMKNDLKNNWNINAITLYDRPRNNFYQKTEVGKFFQKYGFEAPTEDQMIVVSSTSWTKDQDFSIMLNAIQEYEQSDGDKKLRAFITGKGPQKQYYMNKISEMKKSWKKVSVDTVWLEADDYPTLLSLCDLGICLHYSSSGLDLPMKIIDMYAAGIPVLAIDYNCLHELVKDNKNGYIFKDSHQLFIKLQKLINNRSELKKLKEGAEQEQKYTWTKEWNNKF